MRVIILAALAAIGATSTTLAQIPPVPDSAAQVFVSADPSLTVSDFCVATLSEPNNCAFGTTPTTSGFELQLKLFTDPKHDMQFDALGNFYMVDVETNSQQFDTGLTCRGQLLYEHPIFQISRMGVAQTIGAFRDQCHPSYYARPTIQGLNVDPVNGVLYVRVQVRNDGQGGSESAQFVVRIEGLPTLLDIILSYQPPSTLSFNVPVHPEGLPEAESFDVYTGDVAAVSDLSQANSVDCSLPWRDPIPGEHLTVADTTPAPPVGNATYFLVAPEHQGQRRAGRESYAGTLQGRGASALLGCP